MSAEKSKRRRVNPTHRWTERETRDLLETILDQLKENQMAFEVSKDMNCAINQML